MLITSNEVIILRKNQVNPDIGLEKQKKNNKKTEYIKNGLNNHFKCFDKQYLISRSRSLAESDEAIYLEEI